MTTVAKQLRNLSSDEFACRFLFPATASSLRIVLLRAPELAKLQKDLRAGFLPEIEIRKFVNELLNDFKQGERFPHEIALSSVAVLLERHFSAFAEEYLIDLARVRRSEFSMSSGVARECLHHRSSRPHRRAVPVTPTVDSEFSRSTTWTSVSTKKFATGFTERWGAQHASA